MKKNQSEARKQKRAVKRFYVRQLKKKGPKIHGLAAQWTPTIIYRRWHPQSLFSQQYAAREAQRVVSYNWDYDLLDHKGNLLGHLESASGLTVSAPDLKQAELLVKAQEYSGRPADLIRDLGGVVPPEFDNEHLRGL